MSAGFSARGVQGVIGLLCVDRLRGPRDHMNASISSKAHMRRLPACTICSILVFFRGWWLMGSGVQGSAVSGPDGLWDWQVERPHPIGPKPLFFVGS